MFASASNTFFISQMIKKQKASGKNGHVEIGASSDYLSRPFFLLTRLMCYLLSVIIKWCTSPINLSSQHTNIKFDFSLPLLLINHPPPSLLPSFSPSLLFCLPPPSLPPSLTHQLEDGSLPAGWLDITFSTTLVRAFSSDLITLFLLFTSLSWRSRLWKQIKQLYM